MTALRLFAFLNAMLSIVTHVAVAAPVIDPGDAALRSDIQLLSDHGIITGPISTWPLAWGPVLADLRSADISKHPPRIADAISRLQYRGQIETQTRTLGFVGEVGVAGSPTRFRSFSDTPRGEVEVSVGAEWLDDWFAAEIHVQGVDGDPDTDDIRADGSMIGVVVGNWAVTANTLERWWGPGWDGSLIMSNNARPFPALTIDRVFTDRFESKWLSWLGPWDFNVTFGQLERQREVPNAQFFGMRLNFRPLDTLEIGLTRAAQWCGDGRPCDASAFWNLLVGRDNRGGEGISVENEPGNQLAGVDFRWAPRWRNRSIAIYGQFIGEDEAGGFPSRFLGQIGGEWSGYLSERWSTRVFAEFAGTSCQFYESSELFDCAYNHGIYRTGYRYRGRAIGHSVDNDARLFSVGLLMVDSKSTSWRAVVRNGKLNRGAVFDARNTITPEAADLSSIDVAHSRQYLIGTVELGVGYENFEILSAGSTTSEMRMYLQWRQLF